MKRHAQTQIEDLTVDIVFTHRKEKAGVYAPAYEDYTVNSLMVDGREVEPETLARYWQLMSGDHKTIQDVQHEIEKEVEDEIF